ncbi:MAG: efflux RND transporter periplasmic adaptor subunit [Pseudomonadota bacterium]
MPRPAKPSAAKPSAKPRVRSLLRTLAAWTGVLIFMAATGAAGIGAVSLLHARAGAEGGERATPPLPVATVALTLDSRYRIEEAFAGQIEPARSTQLAFERAGLVIEVAVEEGERVDQGAVLARLDTEPLDIERARIEAERAGLVADRELAEATLARRSRLKREGFETGQGFDEARFSLSSIESRIRALDASLAALDLELKKSVLRAPFAGTVSARRLDEGAVVAQGTALVGLQETGRPQARIGVSAAQAARLGKGAAVRLVAGDTEIAATVASVSPDIAPGTRTVAVLVDLDPGAFAARRLRMGEVVRLRLTREVAAQGAWVPLAALSEGARGLWSVLVVAEGEAGPTVAREAVEVLHVAGAHAYVRGSIAAGQRLIVEGAHRVTVGQRVAPNA